MTNNHDYSEYEQPKSEDVLSQLSDLAEDMAKEEAVVKEYEAKIKIKQDRIRDISWNLIPELMKGIGIEKFTTSSGLDIAVTEDVKASIPATRRGEAFAWLRTNGYGGLIKRVIAMSFGRGEDEEAAKVLEVLKDLDVAADDKEDIHWQTLKGFVKEKLEDGDDFPMDLFGVFVQRIAKIK